MHIAINETGIKPSHSPYKRFADEYRFVCSCGYRSGAHPMRAGVVRSAEWHELTQGTHRTTIQRR